MLRPAAFLAAFRLLFYSKTLGRRLRAVGVPGREGRQKGPPVVPSQLIRGLGRARGCSVELSRESQARGLQFPAGPVEPEPDPERRALRGGAGARQRVSGRICAGPSATPATEERRSAARESG